MQRSVREIRGRLFALLARAFVLVVSLILVLFLSVLGYVLSTPASPFQESFFEILQGYYVGHGSWEGVEQVFETDERLADAPLILLDEEGRVILDRRPDSPLEAGTPYDIQSNDLVIHVTVAGKTVGTLIASETSLQARLQLARGILIPVAIISFFLAIFGVAVAILLTRRIVNPLADVIFAAREMSQGKLSTRVSSTGPQDLRTLSESFNEMATALERNDRERRDLLADIAHELRTPLSVIRGRLEGIVDGIYSENGSQVSMALEQTYLLERLVEDLRLLTLAETRQLEFDKSNVDLSALLERVLNMLSAEASEKNIALAFTEKSGDLTAHVDAQRIEQVISNLVGNAIRYVPEGGRVWVTAHGTTHGVSITINDNGAGIPADDLPFIFDRFWRKEKSRARASGGTGLGLAIAKQLVEAQGGTITAQNLSEGGLQVVVGLKK